MENENIQVHLWELPEKTDEIDKANDYTIIHDGVELKRVAIEKLYEYFNQDYKIENTVLFFETLMSNEDKRYEELYSKLDLSIEEYKEIIKKLIEKFLSNRGKIRELETNTNQMDYEIEYLTKSFESIEAKHASLANYFNLFNEKVSYVDSNVKNHDNMISKMDTSTSTIERHKSAINSTNSYISEAVSNVSEDIDAQIYDKGEALTKSINDSYDKIVSIIDYYHHHN